VTYKDPEHYDDYEEPKTADQFLDYLFNAPKVFFPEDVPDRDKVEAVIEWGYQCYSCDCEERFAAVLHMRDGTYTAIEGGCDYTGWS